MTTETTIVLESAFNKVPGKIYHIMPCADQYGQMPDCVRRVDANGDLILSEKDKDAMTKGKVFIPDNEPIHVTHGQTFNMEIPLQKAQWEAIKNSKLIAQDRFATNERGEYVIDGTRPVEGAHRVPRAKHGLAELYIVRPGKEATARVNVEKIIHEAKSLIFDDTLQHKLLICRLFDKDMSHAHPSDVDSYLLTQAQKYPEKVKKFYQSEEATVRLLVIGAQDKGIVTRREDGFYYSDIKLGSNMDLVVNALQSNKALREEIKKETYPELKPKK